MADPAHGLRSFLLNNIGTALTSLVGSGASARVFPEDLPQGATLPAITYTTISDTPEHSIGSNGSNFGRCGFSRARIEFEVYSQTASQSRNIARTIEANLSGPTNSLRGVYGGVNFFDCMIDMGARTQAEAPTDGSDERRYVTSVEVIVSYFDE
jgi:hypothetical protein